ncbi:MAG TPA: hypothetical protein VFF74_01190 [Methylophilaceae bacterium]|nr:hypothetical protein [Methylophilaceae bacterium]
MIVQESFYRGEPLQSEMRTLPWQSYNLAYTLLKQSGEDNLFIPLRSMQYLAVLDAEEFIFIDSIVGRAVSISWQKFLPHTRTSLTDPVPYTAVYYFENVLQIMQRLQSEFYQALHLQAEKQKLAGKAKVLAFPAKKRAKGF